jgi:hypothetical protein
MDEWIDGQMDGCMDGRMDRWKDGWMDDSKLSINGTSLVVSLC